MNLAIYDNGRGGDPAQCPPIHSHKHILIQCVKVFFHFIQIGMVLG